MVRKIENNLKHSSTLSLVVKLVLLSIVIKIPLVSAGDFVVSLFGWSNPTFSSDMQIVQGGIQEFFAAVLFAPLIETLVGQLFPVEIISKYTNSTKKIVIFSATIFALLHFPVVGFLPGAFGIGLVFGWGYWYLQTQKKRAFTIIAVTHALHNLSALFVYYFLF